MERKKVYNEVVNVLNVKVETKGQGRFEESRIVLTDDSDRRFTHKLKRVLKNTEEDPNTGISIEKEETLSVPADEAMKYVPETVKEIAVLLKSNPSVKCHISYTVLPMEHKSGDVVEYYILSREDVETVCSPSQEVYEELRKRQEQRQKEAEEKKTPKEQEVA